MSKPLMGHVVAGYPDKETCLGLMRGMCDLGIEAIEMQVPFSDPIADGETIMSANDTALAGGMTVAGSFELLKEAGLTCDVYIMSYIQKVQHFGLEAFCKAAVENGAKGLIIPDLPYDSPEYARLTELKGDLELVPVLSPGMPEPRLSKLLKAGPPTVYVTSQRGITGNAYSGGQELKRFIDGLREQSGAKVMIGFGIATPQDIKDALELGDVAVVGSAIIKQLQGGDLPEALEYIGTLAEAAL